MCILRRCGISASSGPDPSRRARIGDADPDRTPTVVIIGGGFSGTMAAAQILRRASQAGLAVKVVLVERRGAIGEGVAYSTRESAHLLNVPAGRIERLARSPGRFRPVGVAGATARCGPPISCPASGTGNTSASRC